ncbi:hypothetical protein E0H26_11580 [Micromonospora zingiberis]|uniref:Uncharacterized protein n=1 Tax=Micromonospora zingiberis TaxID=2053011 RepID=A0A4R0GLR3_9ACTN|nr:hypothetical protein [Micromonospora zingiberis]TCB97552.1 hypothetical protein E0H26_11580 [Micromonospora zingiberis]
MTDIEQALKAIRQREHDATRGPWATGVRWEDPYDTYWLPINTASTNEDEPHQPDRVALIRYHAGAFQFPHADARADAEFIAHARQDIPLLLTELAAYQPAVKGRYQHFMHSCGNVEPWDEAAYGPINEQGCDACECAPDGTWRPLYVREVTR